MTRAEARTAQERYENSDDEDLSPNPILEEPSLYEIEQAALLVNPWGDGKGDDYYTVFRNSIVVTRKPHDCALCFEAIPAGSRVRAQTECGESKVMTFRFCSPCVEAMGRNILLDDFDGLEKRYQIGLEVARKDRSHAR